jgi:hypothetical protein
MGCPESPCRVDSCRKAVIFFRHVFGDDVKVRSEMTIDVFAEDAPGFDLINDAADLWPLPPGIIDAKLLAGPRVGLAWVSGSEAMNLATPRFAVEGVNVIPDRRWSQEPSSHICCQRRSGRCFALNVTDCAISGDSEPESELDSSISGK